MSSPPRLRADRLWRSLADAQDAALCRALPPRLVPLLAGGAAAPRAGRGGRGWRLGLVGLALCGATAAAAWLVWPQPLRFTVANTGARGVPGEALVADARSELRLLFSDGSSVTFRAGAVGRVEKLTRAGAEVILERGALDAQVIHTDATTWRVVAGPYQVRVTGTRFSVVYTPEPRRPARMQVALHEGAVVVGGAPLATAVPMQAGQRLTIEGSLVRAEPLRPGPAPLPASTPLDEPAPLPAPKPVLARADTPRRLLTRGDAARYAGKPTEARQAFESLVTRFPRDPLAADAVFSLGRLDDEADDPAGAAKWFRRYVDDWPRGPLAVQAAGRLVECTVRLGDRPRAIAAAHAYLQRAPDGPHAELAREVLGGEDERDAR